MDEDTGFRIRSIDDQEKGWNASKAKSDHQRSGSPERAYRWKYPLRT